MSLLHAGMNKANTATGAGTYRQLIRSLSTLRQQRRTYDIKQTTQIPLHTIWTISLLSLCVFRQQSYTFISAVEGWQSASSAVKLSNENVNMHLKWNVYGGDSAWNIHTAVIQGLKHIWEATDVMSTQWGVWMCLSHYCTFIEIIHFLCCGAPCWLIILLWRMAVAPSHRFWLVTPKNKNVF